MIAPNIVEMLSIVTLPLVGLTAFSGYSNYILFEFAVSVIPEYLALLFPSYIPIMYAFLLPFLRSRHINESKKTLPKVSTALDIHRALIQITTTICIFMCDFSFWIERFGKIDGINKKVGMGFMDTGVGAFLFNAGLFSSRASRKKTAVNMSYLLALGFIRLFVVSYCNLYVNPHEYGIHLNFYFILGLINALFLLFNSNYNLVLGILLLLLHEFILIPRFGEAVISADRSSLLLQNKEGLFSLLPYFGWFLICNYIGSIVLSRLPLRNKIFYGIFFCKAIIATYLISSLFRPVSRLTSNLPFTSAVIFVQMYSNTACMVAAKFFTDRLGSLRMIRFVGRNMLWVFLYSNVFVLCFKLIWDPFKFSLFWSHAANIAYLLLNFVVTPIICEYIWPSLIKKEQGLTNYE